MFNYQCLGLVCLLVMQASAHALEDPMRPPHFVEPAKAQIKSAVSQKESWYLNSILIAPQRRVAVINGKRVEQGDYVGSARVVAIEATQVTLISGNRTMTLDLVPVNVKRYSSAETP